MTVLNLVEVSLHIIEFSTLFEVTERM